MDIKVMGPGCPKCRMAEKIVREAVSEAGVEATVSKVTDIGEIGSHGVFMTPAVVIDGEVKCVGRVPPKAEVKGWIER